MNFSKFVLAATMATVAGSTTVAGTKCKVNQKVVGGTCTTCPDGKTNVSGDDPSAGSGTTCDEDPFTVTATYTDGKLAFAITNLGEGLDVGASSEIEIIFPKKLDGDITLAETGWKTGDLYGSTIKLTKGTATEFPASFEITGISDKVKFDSDSKITVNYIATTEKKSTASIDMPDALEMASSGSSLSVLSLALLLVA